MHKAKENLMPTYGAQSTELGAETTIADTIQTANYVNMKYYDLAIAYGQVTNVASDSVITLRLYEATATGGGGSASLTHTGASDTFTSTNTTDTDVLQAEVRGEQLSSGYTHVGARLSTNNASGDEVASVMLLQGRARFAQNSLPTPIE